MYRMLLRIKWNQLLNLIKGILLIMLSILTKFLSQVVLYDEPSANLDLMDN